MLSRPSNYLVGMLGHKTTSLQDELFFAPGQSVPLMLSGSFAVAFAAVTQQERHSGHLA